MNRKATIRESRTVRADSRKSVRSSDLLADCIELLSVAFVRGDDDLPHPANDAKMWTARMQDAWTQLRIRVEQLAPGELDKAHIELMAHEYNALHSANAALCDPAHGDAGKPETL